MCRRYVGNSGEISYAKRSKELSYPSKPARDPLSHVFDCLGARVTRRTRLEAAGSWALSFPALDRLKFVAVLRGDLWLLRPGTEPVPMRAGDVCLLGRTDYAIASDPDVPPIDGQSLYGVAGGDVVRLGGDDTIGLGGTVTFAAPNADFLMNMLPGFMFLPRNSPSSEAITSILTLMASEIERDAIGGDVVGARLADVLVVEALRIHAGEAGKSGTGWLAALLDPRLGRALGAMHDDVAAPWTVARLAAVAGMSRAAFAAEFKRRVGQPPLAYLREWRLTLARAALDRGDASVAAIGDSVGYSSHAAFSQAFRSAFGTSPRAWSRT